MSDVYTATSSEVALTGTVERTVLQLEADSDQRPKVLFLSVSFDGAASAVPVLVEVQRQSTAGTMSGLTARPVDSAAPAATTSVSEASTGTLPTSGVTLYRWYVTPNGGLFALNFAPGEEPVIPASGRLGINMTAPSDVNTIVSLTFEE